MKSASSVKCRWLNAFTPEVAHHQKVRDRRRQECSCPIWVQGSLGGEYVRRSLDLVSWEAAQDRVRGWEASVEVGVIKAVVPTISEAIDRFFEDAEARGLAEATIGKLNVLLRKQLLP